MKNDHEYEQLVDWVPEDGYDNEEEVTSKKDDELEGIDHTDIGC